MKVNQGTVRLEGERGTKPKCHRSTNTRSEMIEDFKAQQALYKTLFILTNNCNWSCNINSDGLVP